MRSKLGAQAHGRCVVDQIIFAGGTIKFADFFMRRTLHADQNSAHLAVGGIPILHQVVYRLPTTKVQVSNTKVRPLGYL